MKKIITLCLIAFLGLTTVKAQTNNALNFSSASSQYVSVPHSSSINLGSTFTIETWVNYSGSGRTIIDKGNYDFLWQLNATGNNLMGFYNLNSGWRYSTATVPQNTWTHVAITLSGGTLTFYINGVASGTASVTATQDGNAMNIGRQQPTFCQCNHFNGQMDELRIWNIARTQSELAANYTASIATNSSGLVAYYKFDEGTGSTLTDATSNANNGTLQNSPTWLTSGVTILNLLDNAGLSTTTSPAAYGLRKLSSSYTGNAIQVRRSSDNTTQNIGFTASGDLDTAALKTFVGANNGFVSIWYDQSGNGRNATQATNGSQPQIVSTGSVIRKNGNPTINFNGQKLATAGFTGYQSALSFTLAIVGGVSTDVGYQSFGGKTLGGYAQSWDIWGSNFYVGDGGSGSGGPVTLTNGLNATIGFAQWSFTGNSSTRAAFINGAANGSGSVAYYGDGGAALILGSRADAATQLNGWISEYVTFGSVLNTTDRQTVENSQLAYYNSTNANLSALTTTAGTITPTFASGTTGYTASVSNATTTITVTPTKADANATIQVRVNGGSYATVASGGASSSLSLNVGSNTVDVRVTAQDGTTTKTYTVTITRAEGVPTISSFTPTTGVVGATVTITGTNFNTTAANNIVYFGGMKAATPSAASATSLTVAVPTAANYGPVSVTNTASKLTAYSNTFFSATKSPVKTSLSTGEFVASSNFSLGGGTWAMTASEGDFNNDGLLDVAVADYNNASGTSIKVFPNSSTSGTINFGTAVSLSAFSGTRGLASADLDGDGKLELISVGTGTARVSIFPNTTSGATISFGTKVDLTINGGAYYAQAADFDGDGKIDIACANNNVVSIFLNTTTTVGSITFASKVDFTSASGCVGLGVGDINGDGLPDLVTGNSGNNTTNMSVLRNTTTTPGSASFAAKVDFAISTTTTSSYLNLADFDGDGKLDVAISNGNSRSISLFRNTSSGSSITFVSPYNLAGNFSNIGLSVGDINGDGLPDVAAADGGNWIVYLNNGTSGTISFSGSSIALTTGAGPWDASIADLDGDGRADVFGGGGGTELRAYRYVPSFSTNADLSTLTTTAGTIAPTFASATTAYTASVSNATTNVTVTPTRAEANATLQARVNGGAYSSVTSGSASGSLSLNVGSNTINVLVTAQDGTTTKTYTITVTRAINTWIGGTSSDFSNSANWSGNAVPTAANDFVIASSANNPIIAGSHSVNNLTINSGASLTVTGTLQIAGSIINNGTLTATSGTIVLNGSVAQTIPTNTFSSNTIQNLTINNSAGVTLTGALNLTGVLTPTSGVLTTGGNLTLKSNALGTASIASNVSGSTYISGNVTVERYVSGAGRRWRFLSSPVQSATVANWMSQFYVTGPGDGVTLGVPMTSGWHASQANIDFPNSTFGSDVRSVKTTSIRTYNESASGNTTNLNAGWTNLSGTSQALTPGQGFRTFIRGPIGTTGQLNGNVTSQANVILALLGTVNQGDITPTLTRNTLGWNLLGNPYACGYNLKAQYDAAQTSNMNNIDANYYVYDATTNGYKGYNPAASSGAGAGTLTSGIIPSGTAFFVQATGTPTFVFKEAFKTTSAPIALHKKANSEFSIKYFKDSVESDEFIISMMEGATLNKDKYDINKLRNENLNLSSFGTDTLQLMLSSIPPVNSETRIKLNVEATAIGTYNFDFKNMDNFESNITVSLFDRFTNKTTDVRKNTKYTFDMGAGVNQWGNNRFELILNLNKTGVDEFALLNQTQMLVYPNPATDVLNINISNSSFKNSEILIYNISGVEVLKTNMEANNAALNIETLSNGVYFVKVSNQNGFNKTVKFVK